MVPDRLDILVLAEVPGQVVAVASDYVDDPAGYIRRVEYLHIITLAGSVASCCTVAGITEPSFRIHRRRNLWGTKVRASSELKARRHAMEHASPDVLPLNGVRPMLWLKLLY